MSDDYDDTKPYRVPNHDIPIDAHFGEIGQLRVPDDMDDDDIDEEEEELPMSDDVIRILGFNPEEYDEDEDEDEDQDYWDKPAAER